MAVAETRRTEGQPRCCCWHCAARHCGWSRPGHAVPLLSPCQDVDCAPCMHACSNAVVQDNGVDTRGHPHAWNAQIIAFAAERRGAEFLRHVSCKQYPVRARTVFVYFQDFWGLENTREAHPNGASLLPRHTTSGPEISCYMHPQRTWQRVGTHHCIQYYSKPPFVRRRKMNFPYCFPYQTGFCWFLNVHVPYVL
jgi:hypothetical protein